MKKGKDGSAGETIHSATSQKEELCNNWAQLEECFTKGMEEDVALEKRDVFLDALNRGREAGTSYVKMIQSLDEDSLSSGTSWLQSVIDRITREALDIVPSCR